MVETKDSIDPHTIIESDNPTTITPNIISTYSSNKVLTQPKPRTLTYSCKEYEIINGELTRCSTKKDTFIIPNGVIKIGHSAFVTAHKLRYITIASSVEIIGYCAFMNCSSLEFVNFIKPSKLNFIDSRAFEGCENLMFIDLDDDIPVKTMGEQIFFGCRNLYNIILPKSLTKIGCEMFSYGKITNIDLPEGKNLLLNKPDGTSINIETSNYFKYYVGTQYNDEFVYNNKNGTIRIVNSGCLSYNGIDLRKSDIASVSIDRETIKLFFTSGSVFTNKVRHYTVNNAITVKYKKSDEHLIHILADILKQNNITTIYALK